MTMSVSALLKNQLRYLDNHRFGGCCVIWQTIGNIQEWMKLWAQMDEACHGPFQAIILVSEESQFFHQMARIPLNHGIVPLFYTNAKKLTKFMYKI